MDKEIEKAFNQAMYKLPYVKLKRIIKVQDLSVGFLVTKGLWYKLRIWEAQSQNDNFFINYVLEEQFLTYSSVEKKIESFLQFYKTEK